MAKMDRTLGVLSGGLLASAAVWAWRDYHAWLALGEGGQPATIRGWLHVTRLRPKMRDQFDLTDLRAAQHRQGDINTLGGLPRRAAPRPAVDKYPVPHRQMTQRADHPHREALQAVFDKAVADNSDKVHYKLSYFEKHIQAITIRDLKHVDPVGGSSMGEIAHIHASDGAMHMVLSPTDAITAIGAGWAQLHGLSGLDHGLPLSYVMVYAPRTEEEVEVVARLLNAAIAYMCVTGGAANGEAKT